MKLHLDLETERKKATKDKSNVSFVVIVGMIVIGMCFAVYCFTYNKYDFSIDSTKERTVVNGFYNSSTQK